MGELHRRSVPVCLFILMAFAGRAFAGAAETGPAFPLRASEDGRSLVDARGRAFFYHADTAWALFKKLTLDETRAYLDDRKARGFTAVHVHVVSKEVGPPANRAGENPFEPIDDITRPNEAYWRHVDQVLEMARERGLLVSVSALWIRWGGNDREGWRNQLDERNAAVYGRFLAQRYKRFDNILWILGGDADPKEKTAAIDALAAAIKEGAPHHLITVHNAAEHASAAFFHDRPWLDVNFAYTYKEVAGHILAEYQRGGGKPRPIVLGESGYEEESNDRRGGDPFRARRQAYAAFLSGALGGHAFGQRHVWRFDEQWKAALDSPATRQMAHVKALFASRAWYTLVPDAKHELVTDGFGTIGAVDYVTAARAANGSFALVYVPTGRTVTVNVSRLVPAALARWFDPTDGTFRPAERGAAAGAGWSYQPPEKNAAGERDWVLVFEPPPVAQ